MGFLTNEWERSRSSRGLCFDDETSLNNPRLRRLSSNSGIFANSETVISKAASEISFIKEPEVNPYRILGIRNNATSSEINRAFLRLALLHHPHRKHPQRRLEGINIKELEQIRRWKFIVISASYETLSNADHRNNYNKDSMSQGWQDQSKAPKGFWDDVKKVLKISDSNEESLDHDGVPCCGDVDTGLLQRNNAAVGDADARDDCESQHTNKTLPRGLLRTKPSMLRGESENSDANHNYARLETEQLFGGPLAALYRARNHEPFSDAFQLFRMVSGSDIFKFDSEFKYCSKVDDEDALLSHNWLLSGPTMHITSNKMEIHLAHTASFSSLETEEKQMTKVYPSLPALPKELLNKLCNETSISTDDEKTSIITKTTYDTIFGVRAKVTKKTRCHDNQCIVRTEKMIKDPWSGKKKTIIEVQRQPLQEIHSKNGDWNGIDQRANMLSACMPHSFSEFVDFSLPQFYRNINQKDDLLSGDQHFELSDSRQDENERRQ